MKPTTIIILGALLVVCLVVALFTSDIFTGPEPDKQADDVAELFTPALGKVTQLTVQGDSGKSSFRRQGDKWRIVEPIDVPANTFEVNALADAVKAIKAAEAENVGDETTGLDKPKWTVTVTDDAGVAHKLMVGKARPMKSDQTYVRPNDSKKAFVAKLDLAAKLDKPLSDFRDKTVLNLSSDSIARVKIAGAESFELLKRDGKWELTAPLAAPANPDSVRSLLSAVGRVTATEFVTDDAKDLAPYGLVSPQLLAEVEMAPVPPTTGPASTQPATGPGKVHTLAIGKQIGDKVYAKISDSPTVFQIRPALIKSLQPKLAKLRISKVLDIDIAAVTGVDIFVPAGEAGFVKTEGQWMMALPLKGPTADGAVDKLLGDAARLKAESFKDDAADPALYGLDKPTAELKFRMAGKGQAVTLLIGAKTPSGEMTFVRSAGAAAVAVVRTNDLSALLAEPATYWNPQLLKLPEAAHTTSLELRRPDDTYHLTHDAKGDWTMTAPLAAPANVEQINKILDSLENLKAEKIVYLGNTVPQSYAKSKDIMQVIMTTVTDAPTAPAASPTATQPATAPATTQPVVTTHKITVAKLGLHCYAWVDGAKLVTIGQFALNLYNDLSGEMRGRSIWSIDPANIRRLRVASYSGSVNLQRADNGWTYTPDPYVKIDTDKVATFLKDIAKLKTDRYVKNATPTNLKEFGLDKPWLRLEMVDQTGKHISLTVSYSGKTTDKDRYAVSTSTPGILLLPAETIDKFAKTLKDFKKHPPAGS